MNLKELPSPHVKQNPARQKKRLSFRLAITVTLILSIGLSCGALGYYAFSLLERNKIEDTWAILYLEMERLGTSWRERLESSTSKDGAQYFIDASSKNLIKAGQSDKKIPLSDLSIKLENLKNYARGDSSLFEDRGKFYGVNWNQSGRSSDVQSITLKELNPDKIFKEAYSNLSGKSVLLYIISLEGKFIFGNRDEVTPQNFIERQLVQEFINVQLTTATKRLDSQEEKGAWGYFRQIPRSNLVLFIEMPMKEALAPVEALRKKFVYLLVFILALVILIVQVPLWLMTQGINSVLAAAQSVARGQFDISLAQRGFGEIQTLVASFLAMAWQLKARDDKIKRYQEEEKEAIRIKGELAISKTVQSMFLSSEAAIKAIKKTEGIDLACRYIAAEEASGDWYQVWHREETEETIFALADVSGHGIGAAMFTAGIAAIFENSKRLTGKRFDLNEFAEAANHVIYTLGGNQWSATMLLMRHVRGSGQLDLLSYGHCPAQFFSHDIMSSSDPSISARKTVGWHSVVLGSDILGLQPKSSGASATIPFHKGDVIVLFTDGLNEGKNPAGKRFGFVNLRNSCSKLLDKSMDRMVDQLILDWRNFRVDPHADDDVCIIGVKAL
ncbi:MAG: PP2C family protein-serine/threonine phosphatase [Proteobacteria bacterium]|nr:PP2C family protein-serine/threonine phosphatase [Pseudomonadota bacterium]